jgi:hypothetical protein
VKDRLRFGPLQAGLARGLLSLRHGRHRSVLVWNVPW